MASSQNGNLGIWSGYTPGDNGWTSQHNSNWDAIDTLSQLTVKDIATTTPPGSPGNGDAYIVPSGATGAWVSQTNKIAVWFSRNSAWTFFTPKNGWEAYVQTKSAFYTYNGTAWVPNSVVGLSYVLAQLTADQALTAGAFATVIYNNEVTDLLSEYNPANGQFVAARTGKYIISAFAHVSGFADGTNLAVSLFKNGTEFMRLGEQLPRALASASAGSAGSTTIVALTAGDVITARVFAGAVFSGGTLKVDGNATFTYFSVIGIA